MLGWESTVAGLRLGTHRHWPRVLEIGPNFISARLFMVVADKHKTSPCFQQTSRSLFDESRPFHSKPPEPRDLSEIDSMTMSAPMPE
jgi:hypothetical protein